MPDANQIAKLDRKFQKSDQMVSRNIAGEVVLVPLRKNVGELDNIFTLNETGAVVWNLLDGQKNLLDIMGAIIKEYEISEAEASQDLLELIDRLVEVGAVEQV
jgi:hypothetical protein